MALMRDNILFRVMPDKSQASSDSKTAGMTFQLDRLVDEVNSGRSQSGNVEAQFAQLKKRATFNSRVYGVFGYLRCNPVHYLVLIEDAVIVGQIANGIIYKV